MNEFPDFTPPGWSQRHRLDDDTAILFYPDGTLRFRHLCDRPNRGVIVCAPLLQNPGHRVALRYPLTITPSILCPDCGTHGWVTDGTWRPA